MRQKNSDLNKWTSLLEIPYEELTTTLGNLLYNSYHEIYVFDSITLKLVQLNGEACRNLGFEMHELSDLTPYDFMLFEKGASEFERITRPLYTGQKEKVMFETLFQRKDQTLYPVEVVMQMITTGEVPLLVGIVRDTIERKQAEEMIHYLSYKDPLTNLPNRSLFYDRISLHLAHAKRYQEKLAVILLNLDRFKNINDSLGISKGDELIRWVGERIKNCLREYDTISRFSGDEFAIILTSIQKAEDVAKVAQRMRLSLSTPFQLGSLELFVSMSLGISMYPSDGEDLETLLKNAASALYRIKEQGGDGYQFYAAEMNTKVFERLVLENYLRQAVNKDEFLLFYQPQYNTTTQEMTGVEALVRWKHPEFGLVSPAEFIPIAEEIGFIIAIDEWVLKMACKQNKEWQEMGFEPICVSVNMSARQFKYHLVALINNVLEETQLDPKYLKLELTETHIIENIDETIQILHELKSIGIQLSIDDFGTGYSSLSYLHKLPVDIIKIDKSFLQEITVNPKHVGIISAIINLAHTLMLKVIVEGVETLSQYEILLTLHCDEMQGFYFSKPVPKAEIQDILRNCSKRDRSLD